MLVLQQAMENGNPTPLSEVKSQEELKYVLDGYSEVRLHSHRRPGLPKILEIGGFALPLRLCFTFGLGGANNVDIWIW